VGAHVDHPRILSLCSGIGGLDLGVSRASGGRVVAYCERDPYAASVLLARMEKGQGLEPAPVWVGNLEDMDADSLRGHVDILCAGFPCPPFSTAGKKLGAEDDRDLWPVVLNTIRRVEPGAVFLENVGGAVRHPDGLGRWLGDLAELGLHAEYATLQAADVGAPHLRRRLFVLGAHPRRPWRDRLHERDEPGHLEADAGELGEGAQGNIAPGEAADASHPDCLRKPQPQGGESHERGRPLDGGASRPRGRGWWDAEPDVGRVADGIPARVDRLRCLGNAVVPQQAEHAYRELSRRMKP